MDDPRGLGARRAGVAGGASLTTPIQPADELAVPRARRLLVFDPLLLLAAMGLVACSVMTLRSSSGSSSGDRQLLYGGVGVLLALLVSRIDYGRLREYKLGLYGVMVILNLVVYAMPRIQGAHRWIPLPLIEFQSSEFGKLLVILSLAGFAVDRVRQLHERRTTARIMLLALVAALLVIPQPDLSTGIVYVVVGVAILFFVGTSTKQLGGLAALFAAALAIALVGAPAVGVHVLKGYQAQRLTAFLHPAHCPKPPPGGLDPCYQLQQSEIAIGSGQKTGLGHNATQTNLGYLPANSTDFVFASLGETYGFIGAAVVLSLYALLIWRALRILTMAKNLFGTLIAGGILAMLSCQVFLNVGMTVGIAPVAGVPLPLVSYGGSSVIVTFIAIGLLESIYIQARLAAAGKSRPLVS